MSHSLTGKEEHIRNAALAYINSHKDTLIQQFILDYKVIPIPTFSIFMAGVPGAGKTEFAEEYVKRINASFKQFVADKKVANALSRHGIDISVYRNLLVHLDIDRIREFIPQYQKTNTTCGVKGNAHIIQSAAGAGLEILRRYCINNDISFLLDGTFGNQFSTFDRLIRKMRRQGRKITIFYVYSHPTVAWQFTKKREIVEGRNITKENFIKQYFKSIDNIRRAKEKFGDNIELNCILKDRDNRIKKILFNESSLDNILKLGENGRVITEGYLEDILE